MSCSSSSAFIQTRNPSSFGCGFRRILYVIGLVGDDSDESGDTETHRYTHMDETRREHIEQHGSTAHGYDHAPDR